MISKRVHPLSETAASGPRITARHVLSILALFTLLTSAWALATPLMGVPDEPAHTIRAAAVARGELIGDFTETDKFSYPKVEVPKFIAESTHLACFAGQPTKTANCQVEVPDDSSLVISSSSAASNSPLYYAIVGLPSLVMSGTPALYAMRIMSAILTSLLLTTMIVALAKQSRSWWPAVAGIVGVTPMALFLGGAINPNAAEMASAGAVLAVLSLILRRPLDNAALWRYGTVAILSTFVLTGGRSIGLLWLAIIGVFLLILTPWRRIVDLLRKPPIWYTLAGMAVAAILLVLWFKFSVVAVDPTGRNPLRPPGIPAVVLIMLEATFDSWSAWIGQFGWLDYAAPSGALVTWYAAIGALLFTSIIASKGRARLALIFVAVATLVVPPIVQASLYNEVGWLWQGRYAMPLYLCLLLAAGIALDDALPSFGSKLARRSVRAGVVVLAVAQIATFVFVLRRYVVGSQSWSTMLRDPAWQPPLGWMALTLVFTLTWVGVIVYVFRWTKRTSESEPAPDLTTGAPTAGVYAGTHGTTDPSSGTETPIHLDEQAPGRLNPTAVVPS